MIKSLYDEYFQKSRIFLYPALMIPRGVSVTPIETYMSWTGRYSKDDCKLMCLYHLRSDTEFKSFEKAKLFGNYHFHDFYEVDDTKGVYVFDYQEFKEDWDKVLVGRYSTLSKQLKSLIQDFYAKSKKNYVYVDSYLHPDMYYDLYSKILECDKKLLEDVGELCDKPDFEKETLSVNIKELKFSGFDITSP